MEKWCFFVLALVLPACAGEDEPGRVGSSEITETTEVVQVDVGQAEVVAPVDVEDGLGLDLEELDSLPPVPEDASADITDVMPVDVLDEGSLPKDEGGADAPAPAEVCSYECYPEGQTKCAEDVAAFATCGEYDDDECLEWGPVLTECGDGQLCYDHVTNDTTGESYSECGPSCVEDVDCHEAWWGKLCLEAENKCVQCVTLADCKAISPHFGVCSDWGKCKACLTDEHCTANDHAFGPKCQGYEGKACRCENDADCGPFVWGNSCHLYSSCGCSGDDECGGEKSVCQHAGYYERRCGEPCSEDADCPKYTVPKCNTGTGVCGECSSDLDCGPYEPVCHPETGLCVPCVEGEHCKRFGEHYGACWFPHPNHPECVECLADIDCAANPAIADGSKCTSHWCVCLADADCTGISKGPKCFEYAGPTGPLGGCGCVQDADCAGTPGAKCLPHPSKAFKSCRVPCGVNADCAAEPYKKVCDPAYSLCVPCLANEDCLALDPTLALCLSKGCYQCVTTADCEANPDALGPECILWDTGPPTCGCMDDPDCKGNPNGPKCTANTCGCSATEDCAPGKVCFDYEFGWTPLITTCQEP